MTLYFLITGKPLGNGHPMALVVTRKQIASCLGEDRLNCFTCDNVTAAIGISVLNTVRNENMMKNARNVGSFLREGLKTLMNDHPNVGECAQ